ncbi:hypothetical protein [Roseovarius sp.]|uniref:phage tail fiber protein n=1 Tax=Roseovarius sp. TaxID=1486281 RepID=UPI003A969632
MSSFTTYLEAAILNHVFRNVALTSPATIYLALFTSAPTDAGGGTEVSGSGYARQVIAFDAPAADPADATRQAVLNSAAIPFVTTHDPVVSVVAYGLFDAATLGNMLTWAPIPASDLGVNAEVRVDPSKIKQALS